MNIPEDVIKFFEKQGHVIVSTIDPRKRIHCSVKGMVRIGPKGQLLLIDLYLYRTFQNLKKNSTISITALNERLFKGYTLQGQARIIPRAEISQEIYEEWERHVIRRISKRVANSVKSGSRSKQHFEADLPVEPKYLIEVKVVKIVDLAPPTQWKKKR
jgi:hypothetical protein